MKIHVLLLLALAGLSLCACNGGSSGDSQDLLPPGTDTTAKLSGIYAGFLTDQNNTTRDLSGSIRSDGAGIFLSFDAPRFYRLDLTGNGNLISGSLRAYNIADSNNFSATGDFAELANIDGSFNFRSGIQGSTQQGSAQTGTFSLGFDAGGTDIGASLAKITGRWENADTSKNQSTSITIDSDGSFSGLDLSGCVYDGNISVDNASINVYRIASLNALCLDATQPLEGNLTYLRKSNGSEHIFIFTTNNNHAFAADLVKQP